MRMSYRLTCVAVVFASALFMAPAAFASPVPFQSVDVTLHTEADGGVLLVTGHLPEGVKLPAQAQLSVPAGATLSWIGELLGGPAAQDPALEFTKATAKGLDTYLVTLTKVRTAQIEVAAPGAASADGVNYSSSLSWTAPADVAQVTMSVRIPAGAQITSAAAGAQVFEGDEANAFYTKDFSGVKAGQTLRLEFGYFAAGGAAAAGAAAAGVAQQGASASGSTAIVIVALVLGAMVGLTLIVLGVRRSRARVGSASGTDAPVGKARSDTQTDAVQVPARSGMSVQAKLTIATVAVLALAVGVVVTQAQKPALVGDTVSRVFATGEACETAAIALRVPEGADPVATAETLFAGLKPITGVNTADYNARTLVLDVGYCGSKTTEAALRSALSGTGLLAASQTTSETATP